MGKPLDLTNKRFGQLTVISLAEPILRKNGYPVRRWLCRCDCNNYIIVLQNNLTRGNSTQCASCASKIKASNNLHSFKKRVLPHNFENLIGRKFGKLTVINGPFPKNLKNGNRQNYWLVRCECGFERMIFTGLLKRSKSCFKCSRKRGKEHSRYSGGALKSEFERQKKRALKERSLIWSLSFDQFSDIVKHDCYYCGAKPQMTVRRQVIRNTIDRLDSKEGYTIENVVPACNTCNMAKKTTPLKDFLDWVKRVYNYRIVGFAEY